MNFRIVYADYMQNLPEAAWNCTRKSFKFNQNSADLVLPRLKSRVRIPFPAPLQVKNSKQLSVSGSREWVLPKGSISIFCADLVRIFEPAQIPRGRLDPGRILQPIVFP